MERTVATIRIGEVVLAKDLVTEIEVAPGGIKRWRGHFVQPAGTYVPSGGPYVLTTVDGRSGHIAIQSEFSSSQEEWIDFDGTGPLR